MWYLCKLSMALTTKFNCSEPFYSWYRYIFEAGDGIQKKKKQQLIQWQVNRNSSQLIDWIFLTSPLSPFRNYKKALDVMKQATAMPSSRTSFYDEVNGKIWICIVSLTPVYILHWCILLCLNKVEYWKSAVNVVCCVVSVEIQIEI